MTLPLREGRSAAASADRGGEMPRPQENARRRVLKRDHARALRSSATEAERMFWRLLRGKQIGGLRFRRQQTIGPYVVDFYCSAAKLVVELDGAQHSAEANLPYEAARTNWLTRNRYRVMRFTNAEFLCDSGTAIDAIWRAILESNIPLPEAARAASTLPQGDGGAACNAPLRP